MSLPITILNEFLPNFYQPGCVNVIAGRPSMGKTSLISQFYYHYVIANNPGFSRKATFVNLEDSQSTWLLKIISQQAQVEFPRVKNTEFCLSAEFQRIIATNSEMQAAEQVALYTRYEDFCDTPRIKEVCEQVDVVFIDKLQLFPLKFNYNEFFSSLKRIAVETNSCIVITSDLDSSVEKRTSHRPFLTDFTNAPNIADHADSVIFILRREYYDPFDKPGMADLIIAKNRLGSVGDARVAFNKEIHCFIDWKPIYKNDEEKLLNEEYSHF
jgi:replicative DNA helicase